MSDDESFPEIPWLRAMVNFENNIPRERMPFVRTKHLNRKTDGCFICGRKYNITRHHIRRGKNPLAVYVCRRHHDILHGIGLDKKYKDGKNKGEYVYRDADLRMVLAIGTTYKLFKSGEKGIVTKRIMLELQRRATERKNNHH